MIPVIAAMALSIGGLAVILGRRAARDRAVASAAMALAHAAAARGMSPQQQALQQALDGLAYEEVTALHIQDGLRELVPVVSGAAPEDAPMRPLLDLLDTLERHSVTAAGMEQVLLNALDMPKPVQQIALLWYAGEISEHARAHAQSILMYAESGRLAAGALDAASDAVRTILHENLARPGQALDLLERAIEGAGRGHALPEIAHRFFNEQASLEIGARSLHALVQHVARRAEALAAGQRLLDTAGAMAGVSALDGVHGHVPWVTAVLSVHRELSLLATNATTADRAVENIGLDLIGSGAGGWGGAHIGAMIGAIVFPGAGAAVGAMVGAVAGAMFLRWRSNAFKARRLRATEELYQQALDRWHEGSVTAAAEATAHMRRATMVARQRYTVAIGDAPRLDGALTQPLTEATLRLRDEMGACVVDARRLLERANLIAQRPWAPKGLMQAAATLRDALSAAEAGMPSEEEARERPLHALRQLAMRSLPLETSALTDSLRSSADLVATIAPGYRRDVTRWGHDAAARFKQVAEQLALMARDEVVAFGEVFMPLKNEVEVAYQAVRRERTALKLEDWPS